VYLRIILAVFVCLTLPAAAATYYVDSAQGNDSASGLSPAQAWKSLGTVNRHQFQPGDRILLARGRTWFEQLSVSSSGRADAPLLIGSYGIGQQPVIDAQGVRNRGVSVVGKSYVTLDDIAVQNSTSLSIEVFNSSHISITHCTVRNSKGTAIGVGGKSPDVRVDGCSYSQDPGFSTDGSFVSIFSPVDGAVVSDNQITGFTGRIAIAFMDVNNAVASGNNIDGGGLAIAINACSRNLTGGQIYRNVVSNTSTAQGDGEAIELTGHVGPPNAHCEQDKAHPFPVFTVSAEISHNRIQGGPHTFGGIDGWHAVNSRVHDNQIADVQKYGMQWTAGSTDNQFSGNVIRHCGVAAIAIYAGTGQGSASIQHNRLEDAGVGISADPRAQVSEDYNTISGVRALRSASIAAGSHTK